MGGLLAAAPPCTPQMGRRMGDGVVGGAAAPSRVQRGQRQPDLVTAGPGGGHEGPFCQRINALTLHWPEADIPGVCMRPTFLGGTPAVRRRAIDPPTSLSACCSGRPDRGPCRAASGQIRGAIAFSAFAALAVAATM